MHLKTGNVRPLVAPDPTRRTYSHPIFYGSKVLYLQENALWMVNRDGTERHRLFP
ncbi:MAG: hypothetical protein KGS61_05845 [Verrucomicrobia bacterium]|nr:hypothetical protein [Verrucomicrobiota bacterium]